MKNKFLKDFLVKVKNFSEVSIKTGDTEINPYKKAIQEYIFHWDRADDTTKKEFTRIFLEDKKLFKEHMKSHDSFLHVIEDEYEYLLAKVKRFKLDKMDD